MWKAIAIGLLLCFAAGAQKPPDEAFRIGNGVTPPSVVFRAEPEYSEEARLAGVNTQVRLSVIVGADGVPRNIQVSRSSGFGLDEKAVEAVETWRFNPGRKEGKPVGVFATIEVNFRLLLKSAPPQYYPSARLNFGPIPVASRPVLEKGKVPWARAPGPPVVYHFYFEVSEGGEVEKLRGSAPDSMLPEIRAWRFRPALSNGEPVRVSASLELSYP